jgi:hypothetical protein
VVKWKTIQKFKVMTGSLLYIRFDIAKVEKKFNTLVYGMACYKTVFRNVPANMLQGCGVLMGDSRATFNGSENVCIIGISASPDRLRSIETVLRKSSEFLSVSADKPLILSSNGTELLVSDGIYTTDGTGLDVWAKAAFEALKKESHEKTEEENVVPTHDSATATPSNQSSENEPPVAKKHHGCLIAWLIFIIVGSIIGILVTMLTDAGKRLDTWDIVITVLFGLINIVSAILLLNWKKIGYWLFVFSSVFIFIFNFASGVPLTHSLAGLIGLCILTCLLFNKTNDGMSWNNLK